MTDTGKILHAWPTWRYSNSHDKPTILWQAFDTDDGGLVLLDDDTIVDVIEDQDVFVAALAEAYTGRNVNMGGDLRNQQWLAMFRYAGFVSDGAEKPAGPVTIYRGCVDDKVAAPAWTTDLDTALWFANRSPAISAVWSATVEPRHVLAVFGEMDEHEIVVSPFAPPLRLGSLRLVTNRPEDFAEGAARVVVRRDRESLEG